jgi:PAS domain S-box-containing protein
MEMTRSDAIQTREVDAILTIDAQGMIESFNPAAERIFGYPADEIIGKPAAQLFSDRRDYVDELLREVSACGAATLHEVLARCRDGSVLIMDVSLSRVVLGGRRHFLMIVRDINDRVQAEEELRVLLSLHAATLESTADGILAVDSARRIRLFNRKFLEMWRLPPGLMADCDSRMLLASVKEQLEDPEAYVSRVEELYGQPETTALDTIRFRDGRVYERYSQPQLVGGKVVGRVWCFRDITAKAAAENAHRESVERFAIAVNGANDGIWDWNIQTGALYYSPHINSLLGYQDEEIARDIAAWEALLHPQDHDRVMEALRLHLRERAPYDVEYRLRTKEGDYLWFRVRGQTVWDESGRAVRMAGSVSDITKRKKAEEALREDGMRFRQIFEQSEDAIIFLKPGTCSIIDVNATAEELFGFTKPEIMAGGLERICRPEDFARLSNFVCTVKRDEISQLDNFVSLGKDGSEIIVSLRCKVMTLQGVDIVYCTFRDIGERIRMEQEARAIQAKLIQANKMTSLGLLVSGVAHEINNPNNFILANSQLLARTWEDALKILREYYRENGDFVVGGIPFSQMDESAPQLFAGIIDGARRINDIVNNLKGFARQDRIVALRDVNVNQVVRSAVTILHHEITKYTENFHLDLAQHLPHVKGSGQQLGQVVINLLMNACQALPDRHAGIWVSTGFDAQDGQVAITIRDEGVGMSQDVSNRIMEPFFTTKLDDGGTGLGLFISHSIVKEQHGTLHFTSEPGKGTTFIVKFPAGAPAAEEHSA